MWPDNQANIKRNILQTKFHVSIPYPYPTFPFSFYLHHVFWLWLLKFTTRFLADHFLITPHLCMINMLSWVLSLAKLQIIDDTRTHQLYTFFSQSHHLIVPSVFSYLSNLHGTIPCFALGAKITPPLDFSFYFLLIIAPLGDFNIACPN